MAAHENEGPPIQLCIRHKEGWELLMLGEDQKFESILGLGPCNGLKYSKDGRFLIVLKTDLIEIFDTNPENIRCVLQFEHPGVRKACLSPRNSFLLTYNRRKEEEKGGNLVVWRIASQAPVTRLIVTPSEGFDPDFAPIRWSHDEVLAFRKTKNGLMVLDGSDPTQRLTCIEVSGIADWSVSPGPRYHVAVFVPESKKTKKAATVIAFTGENDCFSVTCQCSFYQAEEVEYEWSSSGDRILCEASVDVDSTGASYYGAKRLYVLDIDSQKNYRVKISDGAPLQGTAWIPNSNHFVAIHNHPFQADVFSISPNGYKQTYQFPKETHNGIKPSPEGRFACLTGFGNLQGHMYFWDFIEKEYLGHAQFPSATHFRWAPNGRVFLTSRLHPTRRVENGYVLWDYCGNEIDRRDFDELYETLFRPAPPDTYRSRPPSPNRKGMASKEIASHYVPPHMRGGKREPNKNSPKRKKRRNKKNNNGHDVQQQIQHDQDHQQEKQLPHHAQSSSSKRGQHSNSQLPSSKKLHHQPHQKSIAKNVRPTQQNNNNLMAKEMAEDPRKYMRPQKEQEFGE